MQLEQTTLTGRPEDRLGLINCQRSRVVASTEAREASHKVKSAACTKMRNTPVDIHQVVNSSWIFLDMNLVKVTVALVYLCVKYKDKANSKMQKVGDFNMRVKQRRWCACVLVVSACRQRAVSRRWLIEYLQVCSTRGACTKSESEEDRRW